MQEGTSKNNFDLDELVSTLLQEKAAAPHKATVTTAPPMVGGDEIRPIAPPQQLVGLEYEDSYADDEPIEEPIEVSVEEPKLIPTASAKKERKRRFGRRAELEQPEEEWADWGLTPIGHYRAQEQESASAQTVAVADDELPAVAETVAVDAEHVPPAEEVTAAEEAVAAQDEFPTVTAVAETITLPIPAIKTENDMDKTRVVSAMPSVDAPTADDGATRIVGAAPADELVDEDAPSLDQLSLEELVRVEDIEDAPTPEVDAAEALRLAREERVREFTLSGDEEVNEPEEEAEPEEQEEEKIEDFTKYEDARAIQLELQYRVRTATVGLVLSSVLEIAVLVLTLMTMVLGFSPISPIGYLSVQLFAFILMCLLNYQAIGRGLTGLFSLRANADTLPSLTLLVAVSGVALHFVNMNAPLPLWTPLAGMAMVLSSAGQLVQAQRVRNNFAFVSYNGDKYAAALIDEPKTLHEIGQRVVIEGEARIVYFKKTDFLSDYLQNAYAEHIGDFWSRWTAPLLFGLTLAASLIVSLCGATDGFWEWLQTFVFALALAATPVSLCVQFSLSQCSRYMLRRGGFMVGWKAVETFGSPDAVTVNVEDLYPDESMLLHGIKTFAGMHIDDAILDAASLAIRSGGPLSQIFRRIIQDKTDLLKEVENLVYEQGMGLSGWVDGRRVLVGNRNLLANHGVDVPSLDYEARYAKNGRRLVYLSTAGELSAMFVVSYLPDEEIKRALQDLCRAKVTVLVRSCDPNVTAADLCSSFELDDYYVEVLPAVAGRMYDRMMAEPMPSAPAMLASNGHIIGISGALSACRSVRIRCIIALVAALLLSLLGTVCGILWAMESVGLFLAILLMLFGGLATLLLPLLRRI